MLCRGALRLAGQAQAGGAQRGGAQRGQRQAQGWRRPHLQQPDGGGLVLSAGCPRRQPGHRPGVRRPAVPLRRMGCCRLLVLSAADVSLPAPHPAERAAGHQAPQRLWSHCPLRRPLPGGPTRPLAARTTGGLQSGSRPHPPPSAALPTRTRCTLGTSESAVVCRGRARGAACRRGCGPWCARTPPLARPAPPWCPSSAPSRPRLPSAPGTPCVAWGPAWHPALLHSRPCAPERAVQHDQVAGPCAYAAAAGLTTAPLCAARACPPCCRAVPKPVQAAVRPGESTHNLASRSGRPPQDAPRQAPGLGSVPRAVDMRGITAMQCMQRAPPARPPQPMGAPALQGTPWTRRQHNREHALQVCFHRPVGGCELGPPDAGAAHTRVRMQAPGSWQPCKPARRAPCRQLVAAEGSQPPACQLPRFQRLLANARWGPLHSLLGEACTP